MRIPYREGLWPWLLQRVTALFLVLGLGVHFFAVHYVVDKNKMLSFEEIAARMATPGWLVFDGLLLGAALYHGLAGLHAVIRDHVRSRAASGAIGWCLVVLGIVAGAYGFLVLGRIGSEAAQVVAGHAQAWM